MNTLNISDDSTSENNTITDENDNIDLFIPTMPISFSGLAILSLSSGMIWTKNKPLLNIKQTWKNSYIEAIMLDALFVDPANPKKVFFNKFDFKHHQ